MAISVRDIEAATRFYSEAVGCTRWSEAKRLKLAADVVTLCWPNAGLVLLPADDTLPRVRRPVSEAGIAHVCIQTPAIGPIVNRFKAQGAQLHSEPIDLGTGFLYCYARDPETNVIEVECVAPVWPDEQPWLAHANIVTHDLRRLVGFYSRLLGVEAVRSPLLRDDERMDTIADLPNVQLRAAWLNTGNAQIELMQYVQPATQAETGRRERGATGFAYLAFEVTGLAEACKHLKACGGEFTEAPTPGATQAWGLDPDGNRVLLLDLGATSDAGLRISALADPQITQRFSAARAALAPAP
ncbi:VOC family protein [Roseateles toxinivorans]|uniref:VOC family protein n=1 Tax=Roseateles toxinivorans TaxID=270368 RepID=UPI001AAD1C22|nr:VOC family protein [Roseateles toxinivorans]